MIGILTNVALSAFKGIIGFLSNSISVLLDAVNNLSDALSSVITIVGTKLATRAPDQKHPLGHGRVEYLSSTIVAALVLYAGITALIESVKKIIHPEAANYTPLSLLIIAVAVVVKFFLGRYVKKKGEEVHSDSLIASGSDASFDALLSFSVLLSAIINRLFHISLEAYLGVFLAIFILKSGYEMFSETVDQLLGVRTDREIIQKVKETILESESDVSGVYDLLLHSYGPDRLVGSVHLEIPDTYTANQIDALQRRVSNDVLQKTGILLAGIGIYAKNTAGDEAAQVRAHVHDIAMAHEGVLQLHGFFLDQETKTIQFDVVLDFSVEDRQQLADTIRQEVQAAYPDYQVHTTLDLDI